MAVTSYRLQEIADALGASLRGDPDARVSGMATLQAAGPSQISFLANPSYARYLKTSQAGAVIVSPATADQAQTNVLVLDNPYMGYARLSHWFDRSPAAPAGVHPSAVVDPSATISSTASIGPNAVIEAEVVIGEHVIVGAGSVVGARSRIGEGTVLGPRVTLAHDVQLGQRCNILSGAVIGSPVLKLCGVHSTKAQGIAMGTACHALGTARIAEEGHQQGAYGALALVLSATLSAMLCPILVPLLA